jgi:hypothetical protein
LLGRGGDIRTLLMSLNRGAQKLRGENLKLVWAEFSTLS